MSSIPTAPAAERNKQPILAALRPYLQTGRVLEIGAGTGQHAAWFASQLPEVIWQPTDRASALPVIEQWRVHAGSPDNLLPPLALDVDQPWPVRGPFDAVYSANTAHIMHWPSVVAMFEGVARVLGEGGRFFLYGPFNAQGAYTSDSNAAFDRQLHDQDPGMGIRDLDDLDGLAADVGLTREYSHPMPANNALLVWAHSKRVL